MPCDRCARGDRVPVKRAKLAERDGKVAVVLDTPVEECSGCGQRWMTWSVARRLDVILAGMFAGDYEFATKHFS